jgi:hypothetical protein
MTMGRWLLFLALLVGCAPIAEAEFSEIEVRYPDLEVPPYLTGLYPTGTPNVTFSFLLDSSKLGASARVENQNRITSTKLLGMTLLAKQGVTDLSFLRSVHIVAGLPPSKTHPTAPTPQVEIADYERVGEAPQGGAFPLPLPEPVDITPLLKPSQSDQRKIQVTLNVGGDLPAQGWRADVLMVLSAAFKD